MTPSELIAQWLREYRPANGILPLLEFHPERAQLVRLLDGAKA